MEHCADHRVNECLHKTCQGDDVMGRGILLWLLGVPIPVIIILLLIFHH